MGARTRARRTREFGADANLNEILSWRPIDRSGRKVRVVDFEIPARRSMLFPDRGPPGPKTGGWPAIAHAPLRVSMAPIFFRKFFSIAWVSAASPLANQRRPRPWSSFCAFVCPTILIRSLWAFRTAILRFASINWPAHSRYLAICFREGSRKCVARSAASTMLQARGFAISARRRLAGRVRNALI